MEKQSDAKLKGEYQAFTELTQKLLAVPKKEVDKEKAKYEKKKQNEKRAK